MCVCVYDSVWYQLSPFGELFCWGKGGHAITSPPGGMAEDGAAAAEPEQVEHFSTPFSLPLPPVINLEGVVQVACSSR